MGRLLNYIKDNHVAITETWKECGNTLNSRKRTRLCNGENQTQKQATLRWLQIYGTKIISSLIWDHRNNKKVLQSFYLYIFLLSISLHRSVYIFVICSKSSRTDFLLWYKIWNHWYKTVVWSDLVPALYPLNRKCLIRIAHSVQDDKYAQSAKWERTRLTSLGEASADSHAK